MLPEGHATSCVVTQGNKLYSYTDSVDKSTSGEPLIRGLVYVNSSWDPVLLKFMKGDATVFEFKINGTSLQETSLAELKPGTYDIHLNSALVKKDVRLKLGGVYTVVGSVIGEKPMANVVTVTEPNSMHILWLIPQYVILTMGEVMFSVTGLEFAFTQAPTSMKSLLQASWLLTVAFGNLIVVIVAEISIFDRQASMS